MYSQRYTPSCPNGGSLCFRGSCPDEPTALREICSLQNPRHIHIYFPSFLYCCRALFCSHLLVFPKFSSSERYPSQLRSLSSHLSYCYFQWRLTSVTGAQNLFTPQEVSGWRPSVPVPFYWAHELFFSMRQVPGMKGPASCHPHDIV